MSNLNRLLKSSRATGKSWWLHPILKGMWFLSYGYGLTPLTYRSKKSTERCMAVPKLLEMLWLSPS
jgi:hypothetical protein